MSTTLKTLLGTTQQTLLSTELNSLANNALAVSSAAITPTDANYLLADVQLNVTFGVAPAASTGASIWLLRTTDGGTTYEDGSSTLTPARPPDLVIPVEAVTTAQQIVRQVALPPTSFKVLLKNDGTGQALAASGNTLTMKAYTYQQV